MASPYEPRLQAILKTHITPFLKGQGFVRDSSLYYWKLDEVTRLLEIERSGFNDAVQASFTITCGIYVPGVISREMGREDPARPTQTDCPLRARLGSLAEDHLDTWWTLSMVDDEGQVDAEIGADIVKRLERDGLPFLQRFQTRLDVLDFLLAPREECTRQVLPQSEWQALVYASILSLLLGDRERSHVLWDEAVRVAGKGPWESDLPVIRERIFREEEGR